jgi:O-antigen ligase
MLNIKQVYLKVFDSFPVLFTFLIPFGYEFNTLIILWGVSFFLLPRLEERIDRVLANKWSYAFFTYFLINLVACFFSDNKKEGLVVLANSACWIVFPLILFEKKIDPASYKKILFAFVIGCFSVGLLCILRALLNWLFLGTNEFYYSKFSFFTHPSYLSMYFIFSQLIVMLYYRDWFGHSIKTSREIIILSSVLILCIFLFASKIGLLSAIVLLPGTLIVKTFQRHRSFKLILKISGSLLLSVLLVYFLFTLQKHPNTHPLQRINSALSVASHPELIKKDTTETTAVRILVWQVASKIIEKNLLLGTTPGDANDALLESYKINGLKGALKNKLNAHNQFLQIFIGAGLPGFILLLFLTVFILTYALVKKLYMLALFESLAIMNFMVESMLVRTAGIYFFVFFLCLLLNFSPRESEDKTNTEGIFT